MSVVGQHALVTGGARGIGAAISAALSSAGAKITIFGRDASRLQERANSLNNAQAVPCDVSDEASVRAAIQQATKTFGPIDILVNNAGISHVAPVHKTELADWQRVFAVNVTGAFLCTREVLPSMLDRSRGRIINIASTAGLKGYTRLSAYCASKHAVIGLTRAVALETATKGITVNAICPTYTESDMTSEGIAAISKRFNVSEDEALSMLTKQIPQGKMAKPEDVATAALWLCSAHAATITGIALPVAGGEVM
jgi:NAD(P)-dependent dehydrogenase (short-subunit alcohol dehydrogenase family)